MALPGALLQYGVTLGKQALGLGQRDLIPGINFGTGTPARVPTQASTGQVQGASNFTPSIGFGDLPRNPLPSNRTTSSGGVGTQAPAFNPVNTINQNAGDLQSQADFEFDQALNLIGQQEGAVRQQSEADIASQQAAGTSATNRATEAKTKQFQGLEAEQQVGEKSATSGLKQTRDLFRQLQQQNIAQLSALGISSSSVSEALAERLGVETAQRISGITGSLEEVRQNIAKEKTNVETVFQNKLGEIQNQTQIAVQQIQAGLSSQLAQLAAARGQAATAKAQARTDIAVNARNQIQQIQMEAQQRAQSVQQAAAARQQALAEAEQFMFKPTDFSSMQSHIQNVQTLPQVGGFQAVPTFTPQTVAGQGFIRPGVNYEKRPEEEGIINPFTQ